MTTKAERLAKEVSHAADCGNEFKIGYEAAQLILDQQALIVQLRDALKWSTPDEYAAITYVEALAAANAALENEE